LIGFVSLVAVIVIGCSPSETAGSNGPGGSGSAETAIRSVKSFFSAKDVGGRETGFEKWDWWFRNTIESYLVHEANHVALHTTQHVRELRLQGTDENGAEWTGTQEFTRFGEIRVSTIPVQNSGTLVLEHVYDDLNRRVRQITRHEVPNEESPDERIVSYTYFGVEGESRVFRLLTSQERAMGAESEIRTGDGWEYSYRRDSGNGLTIKVEERESEVVEVRIVYADGGETVLSHVLDTENRVQITVIDETMKFTYERDARGWLVGAVESRDGTLAARYVFEDHDDQGNWRVRRRIAIDGDVEILERQLLYWD